MLFTFINIASEILLIPQTEVPVGLQTDRTFIAVRQTLFPGGTSLVRALHLGTAGRKQQYPGDNPRTHSKDTQTLRGNVGVAPATSRR